MLHESHTDISASFCFLEFKPSLKALDKNMYANLCKVFSTIPGNSNKSINAINNIENTY